MTAKVHDISSVKSNKNPLLKKALIIAAAATGLIIAGALVFASLPIEEEIEVELSE